MLSRQKTIYKIVGLREKGNKIRGLGELEYFREVLELNLIEVHPDRLNH